MKVIKYVGRFSGANAASIEFKKDVPTIVQLDSVADELAKQPDFVLSSIDELRAYKPAPKEEVAAKPAHKDQKPHEVVVEAVPAVVVAAEENK